MNCTDPADITGGRVVSSGPYADGEIAVFQCNSGYVMSGTAFITCTNSTWSPSPSCALTFSNSVSVTDSMSYNFPDWLVYFFAALCGVIALAILVCLLVCCLQLLGCYGAGGLFGEPKCGWSCCDRNKTTYERRCTTVPRKYEYDEDGRRFHYDDLGQRCYYPHRNRYMKWTTAVTPDTRTAREASVARGSEVYVEKKHAPVPAKELNLWLPHSNPLRKINTSTK